MNESGKYTIAAIEDDRGEQKLIKLIFSSVSPDIELLIFNDGEEIFSYIDKNKISGKMVEIDLILLDLNLPKISGFQILRKLKDDPDLCSIPVIILTTSDNKSDILKAYQNGANGYICKPSAISDYERTADSVINYWLHTCSH